jgi:hypothetical protein
LSSFRPLLFHTLCAEVYYYQKNDGERLKISLAVNPSKIHCINIMYCLILRRAKSLQQSEGLALPAAPCPGLASFLSLASRRNADVS